MRRMVVLGLALLLSLATVLPAGAQPPAVDPTGKTCAHLLSMHGEIADTPGYSEFGQHHAAMAQAGMLGKEMNPGMHRGLAGLCDPSALGCA